MCAPTQGILPSEYEDNERLRICTTKEHSAIDEAIVLVMERLWMRGRERSVLKAELSLARLIDFTYI